MPVAKGYDHPSHDIFPEMSTSLGYRDWLATIISVRHVVLIIASCIVRAEPFGVRRMDLLYTFASAADISGSVHVTNIPLHMNDLRPRLQVAETLPDSIWTYYCSSSHSQFPSH